jgi:arylsulfatase B
MKLTLLLIAALAVAAFATPVQKFSNLMSVKGFLDSVSSHYTKDNHQTAAKTSYKRLNAEDTPEDEEDGMSIFEALQEYLAANNIAQTVQTDLKKKSLDKPHIIYFLIDDLGFNDVSWNNDGVITPNIDALAAQGTILDQAYAQPVCSPSRGALMTGLYPFHSGMQHDVIQWTSPECAPLDLTFLPERLSTAGYKSHMVGKWHLGFCNEACTPTARGFDTFFGFYQGYIDHYNHMTGETGKEGYDWQEEDAAAGTRVAVPEVDGKYAGDLIDVRAVNLIRNQDPNEPMFLYFAHSGVHTPLQAPEEFHAIYANSGFSEERIAYLALTATVDKSVGLVVDALKENGMYDNSVIIFQSDNGGEFHAGSNAPLRGSKTSVYEAGTRTPAMFHSPLADASTHGTRSNGIFHITDWHATVAAFAGADASGIDGVDQSALLLNGGASARSEMVYNIDSIFPGLFGTGAIRVGDFKLIKGYPGLFDGWESDGNMDQTHLLDLLNGGKRAVATTGKRSNYAFDFASIMAYIAQNSQAVQLFNIMDDPEERTNLASSNPDKVAELEARLTELRVEERIPDLTAQVPDPAGEASNYGGIWTPGWC